MSQLIDTDSTCVAPCKMWLIKLITITFLTAVCAAQDKEDDPPTPSLQLKSDWFDVFPSEKVEFSCNVKNRTDWTFIWYHNGEKVPDHNPNFHFAAEGSILTLTVATQIYSGNYSCKGKHKLEGLNTEESEFIELKVYSKKPKPTVTQTPNFGTMFRGESVSLRCMVDVSSGWEYMWYSDGKKIQATDIYNVSSADQPHSVKYSCRARRGQFFSEESDTKTLDFSDPPQPFLNLLTPWLDVFQSEKVELSCEVNGPDWTFTWHKNAAILHPDSSIILSQGGSLLTIPSVDLTHQGLYECKAQHKSRQISSGFSNPTSITVYAVLPKPLLRKDPGFTQMYVGETVHMTCIVDEAYDWEYLWYQNGHKLSETSENFTIPLSLFDGGKYSCKAIRGSNTLTEHSNEVIQDVLEIPVPSLNLTSQWFDVFPTESVELSCVIQSDLKWMYTWYKDGYKVQSGNTLSFGPDGTSLSIKSFSDLNAGQYTCVGQLADRSVTSNVSSGLSLTVYDKKPSITLTQDPEYKVMFPDESVSLRCHVNVSSGWEYSWFKDGQQLAINKDALIIHSLRKTNSGSYKCQAKRGQNQVFLTAFSQTAGLEIEEIPVPILKLRTPWSDVFPTESAEMSCEMQSSSEWTYSLFKNGEKVQSDKDVATFLVSSAGQYNCRAHHKSRPVSSTFSSGLLLKVYDMKPSIILTQNPYYDVMYTEESVSFSCHANASHGWEYEWYKDGKELSVSGNHHKINVTVESHSGSYKCRARRYGTKVFLTDYSQDIKLHIQARPRVDISLLTGWSEVFSTDSLVLRCEVSGSQDQWNYTWFKEGEAVALPPSDKHTVMPQNDPEQSQYTCQGNRSGRPSYSQQSEPFKTKNLLLKRRVLLSISGCLFFGIIVVFLGCIALRVFRKPAENAETVEEPNLFLTMAELKARDDAPCPLVQYITDVSLNVPTKDEDDNCSEDSPLCITSEGDQAVTSESNGTAETNGGLVSFKS
ncbi:carcinoembryonic antigen-related cell adhesion molecule 5 isoform X2 [Thalassophryne amazonica]|uniref:carcinoembryonic antigen-related cell adhesion molecule 5 isoform X2 n=1 Tax=Thalassophryne amazonica TaxID=390379 RepID=UPI00147146EA|nr:carcinoembryonic antigen-related cell adhesion molecule 5 isoform X2 [Thalassophryne amazonica]